MKTYHSAGVATVLSIILPGAGQFFNRQAAKGTFLLILATLGLSLFALDPRKYGFAAWGAVAVWIIGIFDAGLVGGKIVRGTKVTAWKWF